MPFNFLLEPIAILDAPEHIEKAPQSQTNYNWSFVVVGSGVCSLGTARHKANSEFLSLCFVLGWVFTTTCHRWIMLV